MSRLTPTPAPSAPAWRLGQLAALLLSAAGYAALAYATPRAHFGQLLALLAGAFAAYAYLLRTGLAPRAGLVAAAALRLLWLPALPALSDDYHRFRWDGLLVAAGINPYQYRPDEFPLPENAVGSEVVGTHYWPLADSGGARRNQQHPFSPIAFPSPTPTAQHQPSHPKNQLPTTINQQLAHPKNQLPTTINQQLAREYPLLNSPHYYSVYPPVCQAIFGLAAALAPGSARGTVVLLRLVVLLAEAGTAGLLLALLRAFGQPPGRALIYLLNPLVIVELTGNLHFEALMLSLLLLALLLLVRGRRLASAGALGLAVGTKLLPLLALPLLARRLGGRRFITYGLVVGLTVGALFAPFLSAELVRNIGRSLGLYFRTFEFNASFYYLLRAVGYRLTGYNVIGTLGPALALGTAAAGLLLAWREARPTPATLPRTLLLLLTVYYLLATIVHPWYLTPLVALSLFTPYRYPLVWSGLAVLSYATYQTPAYTENLWLVGLEYAGVLAVLSYELRVKSYEL